MATDQPGGPGKFARRNDLGNVKKIQRSAKIQNASGGAYGQRAEMQGIAAGAPMAQAMPAVTAPTGNLTARGMRTTGAFDPTERPDEPITAGVDAGEGAGSSALMTPVDAPDQLSVFARAMYMANPTPQLRRIVEAFEEEGR
jgi:hypothetical protein